MIASMIDVCDQAASFPALAVIYHPTNKNNVPSYTNYLSLVNAHHDIILANGLFVRPLWMDRESNHLSRV